jgi:poly(3-hydroxyalkanoate) depolymerase
MGTAPDRSEYAFPEPPPPGWQEEFIAIRGRLIRVGRKGEGLGRPLLLITGIGANIEMWAPFEQLVEDRELIAFDAPGAGRSDRPAGLPRMRDLANIVAELLDALGRDRVDVLGYSFGGALAQEFAFRHPERVRKLVLCGTGPGLGGVPPRPVAALLMSTPARYYHPRLLELILPHIAGGKTRRDRSLLHEQAAPRLGHRPDPIGYVLQLFAASGWTSRPWLHKLRAPTLVVGGDDDPAVPLGNARLLSSRIPGAQLLVLEGSGHLFLIDETARAAPPILAFLAE